MCFTLRGRLQAREFGDGGEFDDARSRRVGESGRCQGPVAVGGVDHPPSLVVDEVVAVAADQDQIVDVGGAAVANPTDVMGFAARGVGAAADAAVAGAAADAAKAAATATAESVASIPSIFSDTPYYEIFDRSEYVIALLPLLAASRIWRKP